MFYSISAPSHALTNQSMSQTNTTYICLEVVTTINYSTNWSVKRSHAVVDALRVRWTESWMVEWRYYVEHTSNQMDAPQKSTIAALSVGNCEVNHLKIDSHLDRAVVDFYCGWEEQFSLHAYQREMLD